MANGQPRSQLWARLETNDKVDLAISAIDAIEAEMSKMRRLQWAQIGATGLFLLGLIANLVVLLAGAYRP